MFIWRQRAKDCVGLHSSGGTDAAQSAEWSGTKEGTYYPKRESWLLFQLLQFFFGLRMIWMLF
jgi:hypothetical protein